MLEVQETSACVCTHMGLSHSWAEISEQKNGVMGTPQETTVVTTGKWSSWE